jgi:hypothetical protein
MPKSGVGFLVYDRNGDGKISNGAELFGDFTPQPTHPNPNGFLALLQFDQPANGGNMDLILDERDSVWPKLRVWIDDHCYRNPQEPCSSLPGELHKLGKEGIHSIGLVYSPSDKVDQYGNEFRYYAQANPKPHHLQEPDDELNERRMYDVFLVQPKK